MYNILVWIIIGALAGWVGSLIMKTDGQQGALANIAIGIVGALIGGFIFQAIGGSQGVTGLNLWSFLVALVGSLILIAILKAIRKK